jgi:hypothetical protein
MPKGVGTPVMRWLPSGVRAARFTRSAIVATPRCRLARWSTRRSSWRLSTLMTQSTPQSRAALSAASVLAGPPNSRAAAPASTAAASSPSEATSIPSQAPAARASRRGWRLAFIA